MSGKFTKAVSSQAFFKVGLYGKAGTGKTFTSLLWAEGLAKRERKRIAYVDTEHGCDFYAMHIPERKVHPEAFDFDVLVTRSLMETVDAVQNIDPNEYGVVVIDSITHLWEAARAAYTGKVLATGGIPIQAWGAIKKPYKRLMSLFLDGNFHALLCGREGVVLDKDEEGELTVTGTKMKAEGESPHEPHILGRMVTERDDQGGYIIEMFCEKDRSGILTGRTFHWPNYATIEPVVQYLSGGEQGKLGMPEDATEKDVAAQERQGEMAAQEKKTLFEQIRTVILAARTTEQLNAAWSLTKGKKTKLGEKYEELVSEGAKRKIELSSIGEMA